jgi:RND superfamily putative drug exporter
LVTLQSDRTQLGDAPYNAVLNDLEQAARAQPYTLGAVSYLDRPETAFKDALGHRTFFIMGIDAHSELAAEQKVQPTRDALNSVLARAQQKDPTLRVHVTGEVPLAYDSTRVLMKDTSTAEKRIIPVALVFLLLAFGALAAAGIPVLVGVTASVVTLALLVLFGHLMPLSGMAQNIASMVGLGIGIDYSLIIVSRFREALGHGLSPEDAVAETVATAGQAVVYSGITVMIGFLALFIPNLLDTNSLALAGALTVLVSVVLGLTLLPAVLGLLGRWVDWPFGLSRFIGKFSAAEVWYRWARLVMRYPARFLTLGTLLLVLLALPMFTVRFGQFSSKFLPQGMESAYGLLTLENMGQGGRLYPVSVVVQTTDGSRIFEPQNLKALAGVVRDLQAAAPVQEVHSIVENASTLLLMNSLFFRGDVQALRKRFPEAASTLISQDGAGTVIQVIIKSQVSFMDVKDFAATLQRTTWAHKPGMAHMQVVIGGAGASNNDFEQTLKGAFPKVIAMVFAVTFVLLCLSFRSVILPLKALLMNTLSVSASFGALVLVFQHGWFSQLVGFSEGMGVILVWIPIVIFCCVFGLSMDYEVFLLSRMKEEYDRTGDNETAVANGLAATGGIITNAALIMLLVFGAFIGAQVIVTKMLGFGLAVAVLVDALIIRMMLVPSFMALVGRWNWWPHIKAPNAALSTPSQHDVSGH